LAEGSCAWAVGGQCRDRHNCGDPDRWNPGSVAGRNNIGVRNRSSHSWLGDGASARTVSDNDRLAGGGSVGVATFAEGGSTWAYGGVFANSNDGNSIVPASSPCSSSGDESEDWEDGLEGLHVDRDGNEDEDEDEIDDASDVFL